LEAIKAQVPQTEIVMLAKCRHSPHRDQADATLSAIAEFMDNEIQTGLAEALGNADSIISKCDEPQIPHP